MNVRAQEEDAIKKTILTFFQGMERNDTAKIRTTLHPSCALNTVAKTKKGETLLLEETVQEFFNAVIRVKNVMAKEELLSFDIQIDGPMAMAWTPYKFYIDRKFSHCGVNLFTLVNLEGSWKIAAVTDTRRKEPCP